MVKKKKNEELLPFFLELFSFLLFVPNCYSTKTTNNLVSQFKYFVLTVMAAELVHAARTKDEAEPERLRSAFH